MPLDYKAAIYAALLTGLRGNTGVTAAFPAGNIHDDRTGGPARRRLATRAPQDQTSLDIEIVGGDEQSTRTPHFGMSGTVVVSDAIIPVTVMIRVRMRFRTEKQDQQTAAESFVRQVLHAGYPKFGLKYVRDFTIRETRIPSDQNTKEPGVTQVDLMLTVNLRLHLSLLRD